MVEHINIRYSLAFRAQVVGEIESGRFDSIEAARRHYQVGGSSTVAKWIRNMGKSHLLAKVVRVETIDERNQLAQFRKQVAQLQKALGMTQAQNLLNESYLKLACQKLGTEMEVFKKKSDGARCTPAPVRSRSRSGGCAPRRG
jgi:transposase-like protein